MLTDATSASFGDGGERHYGMGASKWREGRCGGAHSESSRGNGEAGERLELANPRRGCRRPEVEDEDGDDAAGLFRSRGLAETA